LYKAGLACTSIIEPASAVVLTTINNIQNTAVVGNYTNSIGVVVKARRSAVSGLKNAASADTVDDADVDRD